MKYVCSVERFSLLFLLFGLSLQTYLIFMNTHGHFFYSLDDPYIHLSLAENIARGVYGINLEEYSSPSSSILYPFLLVPFVVLGIGSAGPFIIAVLAQVLSIYVIALFFSKDLGIRWEGGATNKFFVLLIAFFLPLSLNSLGLPFTGMEHSLHLLFSSLLLISFFKIASGDPTPWYFLPSLLLTPLIRFEGFALVVMTLMGLFVVKKFKLALVAASSLAFIVIMYALFMHSLNLPLLPSSVMVKSSISSNVIDGNFSEIFLSILKNFYYSVEKGWGIIFSLLIFLSILCIFSTSVPMNVRLTCAVGSGALILHVLFGSFGWFGRYEIYAVGIVLIILSLEIKFFICKNRTKQAMNILFSAILLSFSIAYTQIAFFTPAATKNIYQQQYQMHRFITEYFPHTVAVNDIGWPSYKNDAFVVDLLGLGSETVRKLRKAHDGSAFPETIAAIASHYDAKFAMTYESWFKKGLPANWIRMAELHTSQVSTSSGTVTFYLIDPALRGEMQRALLRFQADLPPEDRLALMQ